MEQMGKSGIIGKGGEWYPCGFHQHVKTAQANIHNAPFVFIRDDTFFPTAGTEVVPTRAQFEAVIEWCAQHDKKFEDIAIAPEWGRWLTDEQKCYGQVA